MRVIAQQHDTVDAICWRHFGQTADVVEHVYELNPGLVDQGPVLTHGTTVILPDEVRRTTTQQTVKLWD